MNEPNAPGPLWPLELARLQAVLRAAVDPAERDPMRVAFWRLIYEALMRHLCFHARSSRAAERADVEDICSETTLELLARAESGSWSLVGRSSSEISGYVSKAARFAWIDFQQRRGRETKTSNQVDGGISGGPDVQFVPTDVTDRPLALELVRALCACVEQLPTRGRRVWFFRVYFGMSTRDIAEHPLVQLKAPHVDVLVQRTRNALRDCLRAKGHAADDIPAGAFVELWDRLGSLAERERTEWAPNLEGGRGDS